MQTTVGKLLTQRINVVINCTTSHLIERSPVYKHIKGLGTNKIW
jgi:hypothetical protein